MIEIDGSQHFTKDGQIYDRKRTESLSEYGLLVIRFSNLDIRDNFRGVCDMIDIEVAKRIDRNPWEGEEGMI